MSPELQGLVAAVAIICARRAELSGAENTFAWEKLYRATRYLENQMDMYLKGEVA